MKWLNVAANTQKNNRKLKFEERQYVQTLFEEAQAAVPEGVTALKAPALRLDQREVQLSVAVGKNVSDWETLKKQAENDFLARTGFQLVLEDPNDKQSAKIAALMARTLLRAKRNEQEWNIRNGKSPYKA